jgi:hypothetical protein
MQYNNNIVLVVWGAGEMWCLQYLLFDTIVKHDNNDTLVIGDGNTIPALWESVGGCHIEMANVHYHNIDKRNPMY